MYSKIRPTTDVKLTLVNSVSIPDDINGREVQISEWKL